MIRWSAVLPCQASLQQVSLNVGTEAHRNTANVIGGQVRATLYANRGSTQGNGRGEDIMRPKLKCGFLTALTLAASMAWADTLELKNGSVIKGKFLGGTETEISFQVGSTVQKYNVADIVSLKFESEGAASAPAPQPQSSLPDNPEPVPNVERKPDHVTIPAGAKIYVRTIDAIDSADSLVGDRFQASLQEPLTLEGIVIVAK